MKDFDKYPCVSVIVATHERPTLLKRALESVLAQDFHDYEVLVIHDGKPSDETKAVCEDMAARFEAASHNFIFMSTDEKSGYYCQPRNMAIAHCGGDYIAHLDDDNLWKPHALSVLVKAMESGLVWPDFAYGRIEYKVEDGAPKEHNGHPLYEGVGGYQEWDAHKGQESLALARLAAGPQTNFIDSSSFIASRGAYWRLFLATEKMFNEELRRFGDWELITRAVFHAGWRGVGVDEVVLDYRWGTPGQLQLHRPLNEQVKAVEVEGNG